LAQRAARSVPALTFLPIALVVLERGVVEREESYLEHRFGDT
jgi:protein-S-isoprenylcysteine O-methyltransferase Ste14